MKHPLLRTSIEERDGYVPNMLYSCGTLLNGREMPLPYAVADSFTTFATVSTHHLPAAMERKAGEQACSPLKDITR